MLFEFVIQNRRLWTKSLKHKLTLLYGTILSHTRMCMNIYLPTNVTAWMHSPVLTAEHFRINNSCYHFHQTNMRLNVVNFLTVKIVLYYSKNKLFEKRSNLKSTLHYCNLTINSVIFVYKPNKNAMLLYLLLTVSMGKTILHSLSAKALFL